MRIGFSLMFYLMVNHQWQHGAWYTAWNYLVFLSLTFFPMLPWESYLNYFMNHLTGLPISIFISQQLLTNKSKSHFSILVFSNCSLPLHHHLLVISFNIWIYVVHYPLFFTRRKIPQGKEISLLYFFLYPYILAKLHA